MLNNWKLLCIIFPFAIIFPTLGSAEMVTVRGDKINLRKGPATKYSVKWEYSDGFPLKVLQRKKNWVKVKDFENDTGWIHKKLVHYRPQVIVKANKNKDKKINIRKSPNTKSEIIGEAYYGVVFKTLKQRSGWVNVEHESGLIGWINGNLVWGY